MDSNRKIGIVYYGQYPENRGIDQLAESLSSIGFVPEIVAKPPVEVFGTKTVIDKKYYIPLYPLSKWKWVPIPFNTNWRNFIIMAARNGNWKLIVVRETPLAWAALSAGKNLGIPVLLDMRENLAAMYSSGNHNIFKKLLRSRLNVWMNEKIHLKKFDHIFSVSSELGFWLQDTYNVPSSKCSVLGNYPSRTFVDAAKRVKGERNNNLYGALKLVFSGYIRENRGLQDIIRAISIVNNNAAHQVELKIIGEGDYKAPLQKLCAELEIDQYVEWLPMMGRDNLLDELSQCHVGVCSYLLSEQTNQTLPGKMFEFMAIGLPIFSSKRKPVVKIANLAKCGIFYDSRDQDKIAEKIIEMIDDREKLEKMGEAGRNAINARYNQDSNALVLQKVLKEKLLCD